MKKLNEQALYDIAAIFFVGFWYVKVLLKYIRVSLSSTSFQNNAQQNQRLMCSVGIIRLPVQSSSARQSFLSTQGPSLSLGLRQVLLLLREACPFALTFSPFIVHV